MAIGCLTGQQMVAALGKGRFQVIRTKCFYGPMPGA